MKFYILSAEEEEKIKNKILIILNFNVEDTERLNLISEIVKKC